MLIRVDLVILIWEILISRRSFPLHLCNYLELLYDEQRPDACHFFISPPEFPSSSYITMLSVNFPELSYS